MRIQALHSNFILPTKGTELAGAFDIYMPEKGVATGIKAFHKLGFAAAIPPGHVALLLPRSGTGAKFSVELNNSVGVIDADYRGEWQAALRTKDGSHFFWEAGERVLQFLLVPVWQGELDLVEALDGSKRGSGGFGSSGK